MTVRQMASLLQASQLELDMKITDRQISFFLRIYLRYEHQIDKFLYPNMDLIFIQIFIGLKPKWLPADTDL